MAQGTGSRIEIVDDADEYRVEPPQRRWVWIAVLLGVVVVVAVTLSFFADDRPPSPPPPEPSPGIFDLDVADATDSPSSIDTTYPVLGREWGQTMLWTQQGGIVSFDLDTGASRIWLPNDVSIAPGWTGIALVAGVPYVTFGSSGVARVDGPTLTVVQDDANPAVFGSSDTIVGEYAIVPDEFPAPNRLRHLGTGALAELDGVIRAAVLGPDVLLERGGRIRLRTATGEERDWAGGELLWGGSHAVVWRSCDDSGECDAWAGTADNPRKIPLDEPTVAREEASVRENFIVAGGPFINQSKGSPGARYAGSFERDGDPTWSLLDLVDGSEVELQPRGFPRAWSTDELAFAKVVSPTLTLVSMENGEAARLPILTTAGPRWEGRPIFVPTDELPVIE